VGCEPGVPKAPPYVVCRTEAVLRRKIPSPFTTPFAKPSDRQNRMYCSLIFTSEFITVHMHHVVLPPRLPRRHIPCSRHSGVNTLQHSTCGPEACSGDIHSDHIPSRGSPLSGFFRVFLLTSVGGAHRTGSPASITSDYTSVQWRADKSCQVNLPPLTRGGNIDFE